VKNDRYATTPVIEGATAALTDATGDLVPEQVATPTATPAAGAVNDNSTVALSCATAGATIYYTTDGSAPDDESTEYTEPIAITDAVTIKAIAYKGAMTASEVLTAAYTIAQVATPVATPGAGEVADNTEVALTCATEGATIYYTTDGSTPDDTDTEYTAAITITDPVTIKAIAYKENMVASAVLTAAYTISA